MWKSMLHISLAPPLNEYTETNEQPTPNAARICRTSIAVAIAHWKKDKIPQLQSRTIARRFVVATFTLAT